MEDSRTGNGRTTFEDALGRYRELLLASRNLAPKTRREYTNDLTDLFGFLRSRHHLTRAAEVDRRHLESYLAELEARGLTGNTRRRKVASIRSLFGFLTDQGLVLANPARRLVPPEREHLQPRVLTESEYKRLQLACAHETRDAAVIELLLQTGMRPSELSHVKLLDVHDAQILDASAHTLRHTFATHMARKGTKLGVVQPTLGHASLDTTAIYVNLAREVMDKELQANAL